MQVNLTSESKLPLFRSANKISIDLQCAVQQGVNPDDVLEGTGLKFDQLDDPEILMTPAQELSILGRILEHVDDPQFGLRVVPYYNAGILGKWAIAAMYCSTALDAFKIALQYAELSMTYFKFELKANGDNAFFILHELMNLGKCRRFLHEAQLAVIHQLCLEIMGGPIDLREIRFVFPRPDYADVYESIFHCPIKFNARTTMVVFDSSILNLPLPKSNRHTRTLYEKECAQLLQNQNITKSTKDMVQHELMYRQKQFPNIETMARHLCMSSRTLRRHLHAENSSFKNIVETVRRVKAIDLLRTSNLSLEQIAEQLGYSDESNFCRAFKRWTGNTPSSYR